MNYCGFEKSYLIQQAANDIKEYLSKNISAVLIEEIITRNVILHMWYRYQFSSYSICFQCIKQLTGHTQKRRHIPHWPRSNELCNLYFTNIWWDIIEKIFFNLDNQHRQYKLPVLWNVYVYSGKHLGHKVFMLLTKQFSKNIIPEYLHQKNLYFFIWNSSK